MSSGKTSRRSAPEGAVTARFEAAEKAYSEAMTVFLQKHDWNKAQRLFEKIVEDYGPDHTLSEIVERARTHAKTCEKQLAAEAEPPKTPEEMLLHGVGLANAGDTNGALEALDKALELGAEPARVHYVRASAFALDEQHDAAAEALQKAIELDPTNRAFSLGDPDFERLRETAGYASMVDPPEGGAGESFHGADVSDGFPNP